MKGVKRENKLGFDFRMDYFFSFGSKRASTYELSFYTKAELVYPINQPMTNSSSSRLPSE